jgi:hypothetical protein
VETRPITVLATDEKTFQGLFRAHAALEQMISFDFLHPLPAITTSYKIPGIGVTTYPTEARYFSTLSSNEEAEYSRIGIFVNKGLEPIMSQTQTSLQDFTHIHTTD